MKLITVGTAGTLAIATVLIAHHEGDGPKQTINGVAYHLSYQDSAGIWTICRGLTGRGVGPNQRMTTDQCEMAEAGRLDEFEAAIRRLIPRYDTFNKWRQAALLSFAWNVGLGNLETSTIRRLFNARADTAACNELVKWNKSRVRGVLTTLRGLVTRRADELELCLNWKDVA